MKLYKKLFRKSTYIKGAIILITAIAAVAQFIKQSFFSEKPKETLALFAILFYIVYSDVNEHFILAIAMFLCLYFSYDTLTTLIKNEVKSRNDQIYSFLADNVEKQMNRVISKKVQLAELKDLIKNIKKINDTYKNNDSFRQFSNENVVPSSFVPKSLVERNVNLFLLEELSYLDFLYTTKKEIFENSNKSFDNDSEFTLLKLEELE